MGDPAGIGGEIALKAWRALRRVGPSFIAIDRADRLRRLAVTLGVETPITPVRDLGDAARNFSDALPVWDLDVVCDVEPGRPTPAGAEAAFASLSSGASLVRDGLASALVTNPIHKRSMYDAGFGFPGHTEYLRHAFAGVVDPVMMLAGPDLRVALVTSHLPLSQVPEALTHGRIVEVGQIVADALSRDFGRPRPKIAVAGLNPHAGEDGALGTEDRDVIAPAIRRLADDGLDVHGPMSADTMFHAAARARYDAAIAMYHDQALIPVKTLHFDAAVNVTLGLPHIRTSPDHGTAHDIAGRGQADPSSLIAALKLASDMAARRASPS